MFQLPANVFANVVGAGDVTYEATRHDKRRHSRAHLSRRATALGLSPRAAGPAKPRHDGRGADTPVVVRDVSISGAGLYTTFAMNAGDEFVLLLPCHRGAGRTDVPLLCRVARCQSCGKNAWSVGVSFLAMLRADEATPEAIEMRRIRQAILAG